MLNRRELIRGGIGAAAFVGLTGFGPCDKVTKDKAVRYTGIVIDYMKDILPLVSQLGGTEMAALINKALPLLEKLKAALDNAEIPTAEGFFNQVTGILSQVAAALLQLPESARRDTIMGILTLVNITLRTVQLFVESEAPAVATTARRALSGPHKPTAAALKMRAAFEATKF